MVLAWRLAKPTVVAPILGARTLKQLADNLGATGWELTSKELTQFSEACAIGIHSAQYTSHLSFT